MAWLVVLTAAPAYSQPAAEASAPASQSLAISSYSSDRHDELIARLRAATVTPAQAVHQLEAWLSTNLGEADMRRVASDAVVVATQAREYAQAVRLGHAVTPARVANFALPSLALAARRVHDAGLLDQTVAVWRAREPAAREPFVYAAYARLENQDVAGAKAIYSALPAVTAIDARVETLELRAAIATADKDSLQALAAYNDILLLRPGRLDTQRAAGYVVADMGGASAAFDKARQAPAGAFSPQSLAWLEQQALGERLKWAIRDRDQQAGSARVESLDRVLADQEAALLRAEAAANQGGPEASGWNAVRRGLHADRLLALVERGRPADAVDLHDRLRAAGVDLPAYALGATASALTQLRRSEEAVPLYEAAISKAGPDAASPNDTELGLVYAYLDTARFEQADALLQRLESVTPALLRLTPQAGRENPQYTDVAGLRGLYWLYTDRAALAEERFAQLTQYAPLNPGYAYGGAVTERMREHPEAAVARFEALAANAPDDISGRAGYVEALIDVSEYAEARRRAESLSADAPDAAETRDTRRKLSAATAPRLDIDAQGGRGGGTLSNSEWRVDSRLSSGLINDAWRVFYDQSLGRGNTSDGNANWLRGGLGLGWEQGRWLVEGALQQANSGRYRTSVGGRVDYRASDQWRLSATYDGDSKELPWKARVARVGAREFGASAGYIVNESRRFDLSYARLDFSDGNLRNGVAASWSERWISAPRFHLDSKLSADGSRNSQQDVAYFSPSSDSSVGLALRGQWLNWKSDDRQFFQAVELSAGRYQQAGFGSGPEWSIRYEHRWDLGPRFTLRYGLSYGSHPYDGVRERQRAAFLNLSTPLN